VTKISRSGGIRGVITSNVSLIDEDGNAVNDANPLPVDFISSCTNPVYAELCGTSDVNLVGTPNVNIISSCKAPVYAELCGISDVNLVGTTTMDVNVTNTCTNPVYAELCGTSDVNLVGTTTMDVNVTNTCTNPVYAELCGTSDVNLVSTSTYDVNLVNTSTYDVKIVNTCTEPVYSELCGTSDVALTNTYIANRFDGVNYAIEKHQASYTAATTTATIWTPGAGCSIRLTDLILSSAASNTITLVIGTSTIGPFYFTANRGLVSNFTTPLPGTADAKLMITQTSTASITVTGYEVC